MSFIRPGQSRKKKAFVRKRPTWDESVSDLDAYKATPEEIASRRESHKSKNHISVKLEKIRKDKQRQRSGLSHVEARQVAIMKEVLHDQSQLDSVLSKTDGMLAMVKDLFGDDAKKYTGHPTITMLPGNQLRGNSSLPSAPEIRTRIEKLSESVVSQSALNDLSDYSDEDDDDDEDEDVGDRPEAVTFQPRMNLHSFQQFLQEEENRNSNAVPTAASLSHADLQRLQQLQQVLLAQEQQRNHGNHTLSTISGQVGASLQLGGQFSQAEGPAHSTRLMAAGPEPSRLMQGLHTPPSTARTGSEGRQTPTKSALNDTGKVKRSRRRVQPSASPVANSAMNMTDMRQVLNALQGEIADFERRTGRRSAADAVPNSESFTGYTVALVTAVTKLTHYMKETELRLQAEMMVREQLAQDVRQLTVTVDSITQEMIVTQEDSARLARDFHNYGQQMQGEMALLKAQLLELKHQQSSQGSRNSTPGRAASAGSDNGDENFAALPDHMAQPSAAAVLLSPLVRKTRVADDDQTQPLKAKRQTSLVDIPGLLADPKPQQQQQQQTSQRAAAPAYSRAAATTNVSMATSTYQSTSSSSANSGGGGVDPPRLTQTLPVMATVSVPRPIPLVQSNVGLPLSGSQAAGPLHSQSQGASRAALYSSSGAAGTTSVHTNANTMSAASVDGSRAMETQIAELNRQHEEAQQRLQTLLVQQKRQHDQIHYSDIGGDGSRARNVQQGVVPSCVSPPISPISHRSERFEQLNPAQRLASMSREIKVAMPMIDLEVSAGSLNSSA